MLTPGLLLINGCAWQCGHRLWHLAIHYTISCWLCHVMVTRLIYLRKGVRQAIEVLSSLSGASSSYHNVKITKFDLIPYCIELPHSSCIAIHTAYKYHGLACKLVSCVAAHITLAQSCSLVSMHSLSLIATPNAPTPPTLPTTPVQNIVARHYPGLVAVSEQGAWHPADNSSPL